MTTIETVALDRLRIEPALQARRRHIDPVTVNRYRGVVRAAGGDPEASKFPPVKIAEFPNGELYVLDGFHRVEAYRLEDMQAIKAERVACASAQEARWAAAEANLDHGKPLTSKELKVAFQRFVDARRHRQASEDAPPAVIRARPKPGVMTAPEIAQVFGKDPKTIRGWFQKHDLREYNLLYRRDLEDSGEREGDCPGQQPCPAYEGAQLCAMSLENAMEIIASPLEGAELTACLREFLKVGRTLAELTDPEVWRTALQEAAEDSSWLAGSYLWDTGMDRPVERVMEASKREVGNFPASRRHLWSAT